MTDEANAAREALEMSPAAIGATATVTGAVMTFLGRLILGKYYRGVGVKLDVLQESHDRVEAKVDSHGAKLNDVDNRLARLEGRFQERDHVARST
jgi:hypothetical protein